MDVRPGYKQTEVGVIPEDWEVHRSERRLRPRKSAYAHYAPHGIRDMSESRCFAARTRNVALHWADIHVEFAWSARRQLLRTTFAPGDVVFGIGSHVRDQEASD